MALRYFLYAGVDAGATRTRCAVVTEDGQILGAATGPTGAYHPERGAASAEAVADCVRAAATDGAADLPLAGLAMGVAGVGRAHDRDDFLRLLKPEDLAERYVLTGDTDAALWGAFPAGHGIVVIAGTGSIAFGRTADGDEASVGGWGRHIDDEGGAWWLGREVLRAAARAADGRGPDTALLTLCLTALGHDRPADLVTWVRAPGRTPADVAHLALLADEAAAMGDEVAAALCHQAGRALAELAATCARRLGGQTRVALVGGLASGAYTVAAAFAQELSRLAPDLELVPARLPATLGAVLHLWAEDGRPAADAVIEAMAAQVAAKGLG
jgi:glucosamine kinase